MASKSKKVLLDELNKWSNIKTIISIICFIVSSLFFASTTLYNDTYTSIYFFSVVGLLFMLAGFIVLFDADIKIVDFMQPKGKIKREFKI